MLDQPVLPPPTVLSVSSCQATHWVKSTANALVALVSTVPSMSRPSVNSPVASMLRSQMATGPRLVRNLASRVLAPGRLDSFTKNMAEKPVPLLAVCVVNPMDPPVLVMVGAEPPPARVVSEAGGTPKNVAGCWLETAELSVLAEAPSSIGQ